MKDLKETLQNALDLIEYMNGLTSVDTRNHECYSNRVMNVTAELQNTINILKNQINKTMKETFKLKSIRFKGGNQIPYSQDFGFNKGCPHGIEFKAQYLNKKRIILTAPGYGSKGAYGNGCIYVSVKDLIK